MLDSILERVEFVDKLEAVSKSKDNEKGWKTKQLFIKLKVHKDVTRKNVAI